MKKNYEREIERAQSDIARKKQRIKDIQFQISQGEELIGYWEGLITDIDKQIADATEADKAGNGESDSGSEEE